jgi:biotin synthase
MNSSIQTVLDKALDDKRLTRDEIITLLSIDADSQAVEFLYSAGREGARLFSNNHGRIWAAIGVDYMPCPMNCRFCSFGEAWGLVESRMECPPDQIEALAAQFADQGAHWITLRTTEDYPIEKLADLCRRVIQTTHGRVEMVANTGELTISKSKNLKSAGFTTAYHSCRLREGIDTILSPETRLSTMAAVREGGLKLAHLVEPLGVEHRPEEIADCLIRALDYGASLTGAMARVPVPGTPLGKYGLLPERELAKVIAVSRLVAGSRATDICVHPPIRTGVMAGANTVVVETGAVPREMKEVRSEWKGFKMQEAKDLLKSAGYEFPEEAAEIIKPLGTQGRVFEGHL